MQIIQPSPTEVHQGELWGQFRTSVEAGDCLNPAKEGMCLLRSLEEGRAPLVAPTLEVVRLTPSLEELPETTCCTMFTMYM